MLLAADAQFLAYLIPAIATVLVAGIGAYVTLSGRNREGRVIDAAVRVQDQAQQLQSKTALIDSLQAQLDTETERRQRQEEAFNERLQRVEGQLASCRRHLAALLEGTE